MIDLDLITPIILKLSKALEPSYIQITSCTVNISMIILAKTLRYAKLNFNLLKSHGPRV
jgi:hypothetical protein